LINLTSLILFFSKEKESGISVNKISPGAIDEYGKINKEVKSEEAIN